MTKTEQSAPDGNIFKVQRYSLHDGPGIRTTLFFQGCPLKCRWCHNPESQTFKTEKKACSIPDIMKEIEKDLIFFDQSGGGVTFSGGEPLSQPEFLLRLMDECSKKGIHTCLDTSGYAPDNVFTDACQKIDMVLFDIKIVDNATHEKYTNASFKPVLKNLRILAEKKIDVKIRLPLIPGITDTKSNINDIIFLLKNLKRFKNVSLLPFHNTGEGKYERLGMENHLKGLKPCSEKIIKQTEKKFTDNGFNIEIGG